jgi:orotidine-5'-phosphate decarboxylase
MAEAKDKLIVALDVDHASRALELHELLRDSVATFKIGMQLFTAAGPEMVRQIISRGSRIFLDLKFHDIPNTVAMAAIEATRLGVSMFNVHASGGREMMQRAADAVAEVAAREGLTKPLVLGVTLLTSADQETLQQLGIAGEPSQVVRRLATLARSSNLDGVVASAHEIEIIREQVQDPNFKIVCPGMRSATDAAHDQRRTKSAGEAISAGADYVVVGRPILNAEDPAKAARAFCDEIDGAITNAIAMNQTSG